MTLENGIKQKIEGNTLDECKEKLYQMYGKDYSIENRESKFKRCGFLGLRQKEVQVVYYTVNHKKAYDSEYSYEKENEEIQLERNRRAILEKQNNLLLTSHMNQVSTKLEAMTKQIEELTKKNLNAGNDQHETIRRIEELLEQNEFTMSYIKMIEEKIRNQFSLDDLEDFKLVERYVIDWIGESIQIAQPRTFRPPHVFIIVGPTGVGKTTTIAKLASNTILDARNKGLPRPEICLLTIDTMRVGAQEQLTKFGDILDKAVLKAESADDVRQIYEEYKDHVDYIFIDTSGYSPNDSNHISQMKNMLDVNMNPDIYLSVTATTKASDLQNIFRNYEPFGYESVIITKCDETKQFGNVISVLWDKHKSISYICDGQGVPRNIRRANIIDFLKNLSGFDVDRVHIEDKFGEK